MKGPQSGPARPRKSWGQNFLIDHNIQRKILDLAEIVPGERVVEIGPGRGILTKGLLDRGAEVTAVEIDPRLVEFLQKELPHPKLNLILGDALRHPYERLPAPYKVVANLPYYLSTPLLFRLLQERRRVDRMVLMLQKEVADRLAATVGRKSYGALSIIIQFYADIRVAFTVSPNCFQPRPLVDSAVVELRPLPSPRLPVRDELFFSKVVKGAFAHRRKRLANALADAGFSRGRVESVLSKKGFDPSRRGETLTPAEFAALSDLLFDSSGIL